MGKEVFTDSGRLDIIGNRISVQPYNQIEMRLDDPDYADFTDTTVVTTGTVTQTSGEVTVASGTSATGSATLSSTDNLEYRPSFGLYGGGTAVFSAGAAGCNQYAGLVDTALTLDNCLVFGRKDGVFGILHRKGGSEISFTAQSDWNEDKCQGAIDSKFRLNDSVVTLDPASYGGPYWVECGLFGHIGWKAYVWSPDEGWILVHEYKKNDSNTVFTSNSFKVALMSVKTSGAESHTIRGQCWVAGTYSTLERLGATLTDRTLIQNARAVITGKTTAGGGAYVDVKVSPSGSLAMEPEQATHDNLNLNANIQVGDVDVSETNKVPIKSSRLDKGKTSVVATVTASGDTTIHTPASGKAVRLYWVSAINDPTALTSPVIKVLIGTTEYYRAYAVSHWEIFEGAANEVLKINLSITGTVQVTAHIEEFTP